MKPKDQMKTALLVCALTSMSPAFANGTMVKADNLNRPTTSIQQQKKVATGRVVDNQGEPLIGVTVMEVGTSNGTVTDLDGNFSLSLKNPNGKITISYVGFNPQTLTAASNMQITMKSEDKELNEVVVVGYGTQKKVNLTGSVSSVDSKALESRPIQNVQSGLQGMMPGVTISGTNGAPGMDSGSINVRGVGTLNASSPYILIDGVESGTMSSLDPNDIESISVLKDAASAAIYGSKAANGVILITTKRGKSGKPQVSYNGYVSMQNPTSLVDRLDSYEYAHMLNDALESEGKAKKFTSEEEINALPNTDWYDLAYKTGSLQHHNVSVNGGTESVNYLASVGYLKQSGILPHAGREQINGRTNLEMKINSRLTARLNLAYIKNDYTDPSSAYAGGGSDQIIRQLKAIGIVVNPLLPFLHADAKDICNEIQELNAGHIFIQIGIIRNIRQLLFTCQRVFLHRHAADDNFSLVKLLDADHGFERCGLSRPVVPDKAVDLPRRNVQAEVIHGFFLPIALGQMFYFEHDVLLFSLFIILFSVTSLRQQHPLRQQADSSRGKRQRNHAHHHQPRLQQIQFMTKSLLITNVVLCLNVSSHK